MKFAPAAVTAALLSFAAGTALAQPSFVVVAGAEDIDTTGTKTVGRIVEWYPGPAFSYVPYTWQRTTGHYTRVPGTYARPEMVRGNADLTQFVSNLENTDNWGDLNCFNGYCFGEAVGCTPGDPRPANNPCIIPNNTHHYSPGTGWVNAGSLPRYQDVATGRFYGGTRCDQTITSPYDISGNGRYIVGGAYDAPLFTSSGGPAFGLCGAFRAFTFDSTTGIMTTLPSVFNSNTTRADRVNHDGSVITGYDLESINHPDGSTDNFRRLVAWTNGVETVLDSISNTATTSPINGPGTVIAGSQSSAFNSATYGTGGLKLTRWNRQPNDTWTPQNLGRVVDRFEGVGIDVLIAMYPTAISDDGNTIVGTAVYNALGPGGLARAFIWNPNINGGVPIDLADHVAQLDPSNPVLASGFLLQSANNMSADGNHILIDCFDRRNTCTNGGLSHATFTTGILSLNSTGLACVEPSIVIDPTDWAMQEYYTFGASMNVTASGSFPLSYQWQREDPNTPGTWIDLTQDCSSFPAPGGETGFAPTFSYEGVYTAQLRIGMDFVGVCGRLGNYRVVISNSCGSVISDPAELTVGAPEFVEQPEDATICRTGSASFTVRNPVYEPRLRRWQVESPEGSGQFVDVYGPYFTEPSTGMQFDVLDEFTPTLTISNVNLGTHSSSIHFRNQVDPYACNGAPSNSDVATLTLCLGDADCDGDTDSDDIVTFFTAWDNGESLGDVDGDGDTDSDDIITFFGAWDNGC